MYAVAFHFLTQIDYFSLEVSNIPNWKVLLLQLAFCFFMEDTAHYWFHRWLHTPWAYHVIHKMHHEFESPTILSTSFAHPLEILILGFATFLGPLLLRPHFLTLLIFVNLRQLAACETHSGFDFPFSPNNLAPNLIGGADFHDFHHRRCSGVFSSNFMWWDIWCGTCGGFFEWKLKQKKKLAESNKIHQE